MKAKHTPGPWKVHPHGPVDNPLTQVGPSGIAVCEVYPDRDWSTIRGVPFQKQERRDADARLIAAAPELLDALETIERAETLTRMELRDIARRALAKAKGES
jgi:hypothetical protein